MAYIPIISETFTLPAGYKYYRLVLYFDSPAQGGYINFRVNDDTQAYCRRMMMEGDKNTPLWNLNEYDDVLNGALLLGSGGTLGGKRVGGSISATLMKSDDGKILFATGLWHLKGVFNSGYSTSETYFSTDKTNEDLSMYLYRDNGSFSTVTGYVECYK